MSRTAEIRSVWARVACLLCVAMLLVATTVEVSHTHPDTRENANTYNITGAENACAICMAAHSPAVIFSLGNPVILARQESIVPPVHAGHVLRVFAFSFFIRPPPLG